jgi:quinohemoprotein amine dehydrogenase
MKSKRLVSVEILFLVVCCWGLMRPVSGLGQTPFDENSLVRQRCGACHKLDTQGRLEVIEETRKSPEEWKVVVDRMIRLNSAPVDEKDFPQIIKELSRHLCLTPEEMSRIAYINSDENSQYREIPADDLEKRIYRACVRCHTWAKIASHRNTPGQWGETRVMHLALYPTAVLQMREMNWPEEFQRLEEHLSRLFPFEDPRWRAWMQSRPDPDLGGTWKLAGYQPGRGYYTGTYTIRAATDKGKDEYLIEKELRYETGTSAAWSGQGTLYSGYHLRYALEPKNGGRSIEGVFDLDTEEMGFSGKWWEVVQDANVYGNEKAYKAGGGAARVVAVFPQAVRRSRSDLQELKLVGVGLGERVEPSDIAFSDPQISVRTVSRVNADELLLKVAVGEGAAVGLVTLKVKGTACKEPLKVYDRIDAIKILPALGRARVSCGPAYPAQGVQFVARAVHYGPDGKADTPDDLILEPVKATWWLEEEDTSVSTLMKGLRLVGIYPKFGREVDDDLKYLNAPVDNGLYMPVTTYEPLKARVQHVEGTGLIAVGASCTLDGKEYKARALLAVTEPDFIPHIK